MFKYEIYSKNQFLNIQKGILEYQRNIQKKQIRETFYISHSFKFAIYHHPERFSFLSIFVFLCSADPSYHPLSLSRMYQRLTNRKMQEYEFL